jgi:hypothetical protein
MGEPPLVNYPSVNEYRKHFEGIYCRKPIVTFDGIPVRFRKSDFQHCMFESTNRDGNKDSFSRIRAERIDWISATLSARTATLYQGWDKNRRIIDPNSRVAIAFDDYVVIIQVKILPTGLIQGYFKTAYVANENIGRIRAKPQWDIKKCR